VKGRSETDVIARAAGMHCTKYTFGRTFHQGNKVIQVYYARRFSLCSVCLCWRRLLVIPFDWRLRTRHFASERRSRWRTRWRSCRIAGPICCSALSKWITMAKFNRAPGARRSRESVIFENPANTPRAAAEARGDFSERKSGLLGCSPVDRQFEPRWTLANFYFRRDRTGDSGVDAGGAGSFLWRSQFGLRSVLASQSECGRKC